MTDAIELKPGDTQTYEVGGQKLIIEPIPFGRLKKLMAIFRETADEMRTKSSDSFLATVEGIIDKRFEDIFPLMLDKDKHPYLTKEWLDDHMTIPLLTKIFADVITINELKSFFAPAMVKKMVPPPPDLGPMVAPPDPGSAK